MADDGMGNDQRINADQLDQVIAHYKELIEIAEQSPDQAHERIAEMRHEASKLMETAAMMRYIANIAEQAERREQQKKLPLSSGYACQNCRHHCEVHVMSIKQCTVPDCNCLQYRPNIFAPKVRK